MNTQIHHCHPVHATFNVASTQELASNAADAPVFEGMSLRQAALKTAFVTAASLVAAGLMAGGLAA